MIDASRSPRPLWKRALTMLVVGALIVVLAWMIWVKELRHPAPHVKALDATAGSLTARIRTN